MGAGIAEGGMGKPEVIIVDSDVLIDVVRGVSAGIQCLDEVSEESEVAISITTQMELIVGCRNKADLRSLDHFLEPFHILEINPQICHIALNLLKTYRLSHGLFMADALIAATALALDCPFVSKNQRDYKFIERLLLLPYPRPFA